MDIINDVAEMIRKGTPLNAIDVIIANAPDDVKKVAMNLFADPISVANVDDDWKDLLLLVYFSYHSHLSEAKGEDLSNLAVSSLAAAKLCRRLGIADLEARFLVTGGKAIHQMRMVNKAEKTPKEAELILKELSEKNESNLPLLAEVLNELAVLYMDVKMNDEAEKYLQQALEVERRAGRKEKLAEILYNAGVFYTRAEKFEMAERFYKECEEILIKLSEQDRGFIPQLGTLFNDMGVLYRKLSKFEKSEEYHREALTIFDALSNEDEKWLKYVADTYNHMGALCSDIMRFDEASKYYSVARKLYDEIEKKYKKAGSVKDNFY